MLEVETLHKNPNLNLSILLVQSIKILIPKLLIWHKNQILNFLKSKNSRRKLLMFGKQDIELKVESKKNHLKRIKVATVKKKVEKSSKIYQ
jgi:hypothetical protein